MDEEQRRVAADRKRRRKIISWAIITPILAGGALLIARDISNRGVWALPSLVIAGLFGLRMYRQAVTAKNR
jgi:hypothetical protein